MSSKKGKGLGKPRCMYDGRCTNSTEEHLTKFYHEQEEWAESLDKPKCVYDGCCHDKSHKHCEKYDKITSTAKNMSTSSSRSLKRSLFNRCSHDKHSTAEARTVASTTVHTKRKFASLSGASNQAPSQSAWKCTADDRPFIVLIETKTRTLPA